MTWTCRTCHATIRGRKSERCACCHATFTGTRPGDMHRVGKHGITDGPDRRRCLTPDEMLNKGMTRDARGYWTTGERWDGPESSRGENLAA